MILAALHGRWATRDHAWILLGKYTGYRIAELLSIRVGDVWDGRAIHNQVTVGRERMKGRRVSRTMPIHREAAAALLTWIAHGGIGMQPGWPLFPAQGGSHALTPGTAWLILRRAVMRAGVCPDRVSLHSLRKSFASRMWASPYVQHDMAKMARLLGHRDYSNTLRYLQFLDDSLENAVISAL